MDRVDMDSGESELVEERQSLWVDAVRHPLGLRVHVKGEDNFDNTAAYWRAIVRHLRLTHARNLILFDELEGDGLSETEWLALLPHMEGTGLAQVRIAHIKSRGRGEAEQCERCARDAGYDARVFSCEQEAERWLLAG